MHIDAVKCVQRQVQQTLSEVQVIVNAEFEATISARVSPIIVLNVFLVERFGDRFGVLLGLDDEENEQQYPSPPLPSSRWSLKLQMASFWAYSSKKEGF